MTMGMEYKNDVLCLDKLNIGVQYETIEDLEGRSEITTDSEGKIISYRDSYGTKVENAGFETPTANIGTLTLSSDGMDEFQQALKDAGFHPGGAGDYSDTITNKGKNPVYIPTPRCAILNILSDVNLTTLSKADREDGVQKVNYDVKIKCEFFDGQGIYFKKTALISAQGNSSMGFIKKNISIKFFDTDNVENSKGKWGKGDTFGTVFGDWVMQKTYHLKAYHTDFVRGAAVAAYQLAEEVYKTRGIFEDRPWKKALIDFSSINSYTPAGQHSNGINNMDLQMDNGARCMPDGFPVIVYQNGEFYGIFSWQLKKDADNFNMDTDNPLHVHIDGTLSTQNLWLGNINWTTFEVRNPEGLVDMDGNDYDGDHPTELIDSSSSHYDATNEAHVISSQVKQAIISLSQRVGEINDLRATDDAAAKELFDTYFDADNLVDYEIINMACGDTDGFGKNWQWTTWDGVKWYVNQYDKDMSFGNYFTGMYTTAPITGFLGNDINNPMGLAIMWYESEIKARWRDMVSKGIFTSEHITSLITAWMSRIGKINYEKEWAKWTDAPCNRDNGIDYENWEFVLGRADADILLYSPTIAYSSDYYVKTEVGTIYKSLVSGNIGNNPASDDGSHWKEIPVWSSTITYNTGEEVWYMATESWYILMKAVKTNLNKVPFVRVSTNDVAYLGYRDSIWRYVKYIKDTIDNQNTFINNL